MHLYEQTKQMIEAGVDMDNPIAARAVHDQAFSNRRLRHTGIILKSSMTQGYGAGRQRYGAFYKAPPLPIHQELSYMVDYGITPMEAIRTATYNAASVLGIENETGSLKEGLAGDLLDRKG